MDRIVEQVIDEGLKRNLPRVNELIYKKLGFEQIQQIEPISEVKKENGNDLQVKTDLITTDLDLEAVSPDSDKKSTDSRLSNNKKKGSEDADVDMDESQEFESPAFEPLEGLQGLVKIENENSQTSGISGLTAQDDTADSKSVKNEIKIENAEENESQLSQISNNTQESIPALDITEEAQMPKFNENSENNVDTTVKVESEQKNFDLNKEKYEFTGTERKSLCLNDEEDSLVPVPVFENKMSVDIDNLYEDNEATTDSSENRMQIDLKDEASVLSVDQTKKTENSQDSTKQNVKKDDKKSHSRSSSAHKKKSSHSSSKHSSSHSSSSKLKSSSSSSKNDANKSKSESKDRDKDRHKSSSSNDKNRDLKHSKSSSRDKDRKEKDRKSGSSSKHKSTSESSSRQTKEKSDEKTDDHQQEKAAKKRRSTDHDSNDGPKTLGKNKSVESKDSSTTKSDHKSQSDSPASGKKEKETPTSERAQVPVLLDHLLGDGTEMTFNNESMNDSKMIFSKSNSDTPEQTSILERLLGGGGGSERNNSLQKLQNNDNNRTEIVYNHQTEEKSIEDGIKMELDVSETNTDQIEKSISEPKEEESVEKMAVAFNTNSVEASMKCDEISIPTTSSEKVELEVAEKTKWPISPFKDEDFKGFDNSTEDCAKLNRYKRLWSFCFPNKVEESVEKLIMTNNDKDELPNPPVTHSKRIRKPNNNYLSQDFCMDYEETDNKNNVSEHDVDASEKKETKENKFFQKARNVGLPKPPKKRHSIPIGGKSSIMS